MFIEWNGNYLQGYPMSLQEDFESAAERIKTLSTAPSNETLLDLYGLYKQGTEGDVSGKKPSRLNVRARAKYSAWEDRKGMSQDEAKQAYIDLVDELVD